MRAPRAPAPARHLGPPWRVRTSRDLGKHHLRRTPCRRPRPGRLGTAHAVRRQRGLAPRVDQFLRAGTTDDDVDRWVPSACVLCSNGCGLDIAVRTARWSACGAASTTASTEGRLGPKGLLGWQGQRSGRLTTPAGPAGRRLVETSWDEAMGRVVETLARPPRREGPAVARLLHVGPADARGVLHPRRHREGRHRHAAHGRQHPSLHGDRGSLAEGVVRHRRAARLATPTSTTATRCSASVTTWRPPRRCCGRACSTGSTAPTRRGT